MRSKTKLAAAGNTLTPAYLALGQKGFSVRCENTGSHDELWYAEKEGQRFIACDVLSLLGLVALWETRGDEWQATDQEIEEFLALYPA